ncbi:hypothetical protein KIW84_065558 [Lathyrus oleraceus]|uniref:Uncharacterized protein n=1 Tax=Pisum sativum TaxID=3888 RepID=A0A9D4WDD0_PEA|nr:hypothetical protein KIW84_065558 [Pisum sativum]
MLNECQKTSKIGDRSVNSDVLPDVHTSLAKEYSPDNDSSEKVEESIPEHATRERRSKKKADLDVNVEELTPSIAKRLQRCKGKAMVFEGSPSREVKRKSGGLKGTHVPDIVMTSSQTPGPATSKKSVIAQLKETCKELEGSIRSSTATKIKLETLVKAMMEEEKMKVVQGDDCNEGTNDEDYAGENDVDKEKEDKGEEFATAD